MKPIIKTSIIGTLAALVIATLISTAGSQGSTMAFGVPLFALCAGFAFLVQWLVFIPSLMLRTEHYYDLTGGLTYLSVILLATTQVQELDTRSIMIAVLCAIWATRLSSFLFMRVKEAGFDRRFAKMLDVPMQFFMTWTLQGLWVVVTLSAGLAAITSTQHVAMDTLAYIGLAMWLAGFSIEVIADRQKSAFRAKDKSGYISTGLWSWSRHPNYFGEILLWSGIAVIALPTFQGWQWLTLISPLFVYILLTRISGVHMLEAIGRKRWGQDPAYQAYLANTSALLPLPPKR